MARSKSSRRRSAVTRDAGQQTADDQARLLGIIASTPDAIIAVDAKQRVTMFNPAAERMFRCPASEALGAPLDRFIPLRFRVAHRQHIKAFSKTGMTTRMMGHQRPLAALRCDGEEFPVEATISQVTVGGHKLFTAIVRDISERLHAEAAIRDSEARFRAIFETAVDGIITIDEWGIVTSFNPAASRMFGYPSVEVIGRNVSMLMPEPDRSRHDGYLDAYLTTGVKRIIGIGREVVGLRNDGRTFPLDLAVSEFRVGEHRMFAGVLHDASNRRRLQREILEISANEQRRIGQELHDGICQQILGASFGLEVVAQRLAASGGGQEVPAVRKLMDLLNDTLTQARALSHGLNPIDVRAGGLPKALTDLAARVSDMFGIECRLHEEGRVELADTLTSTHLFRIAQEAISNAIKHGRAKHVDLALIGTSDEWLTLTVTDDGRGIPATPQPEASGRGLQIMKYRASLIGATLAIHPGASGGTVVTCTLRPPVRAEATDKAAAATVGSALATPSTSPGTSTSTRRAKRSALAPSAPRTRRKS
jgi:PAS domain S-box-containing protein